MHRLASLRFYLLTLATLSIHGGQGGLVPDKPELAPFFPAVHALSLCLGGTHILKGSLAGQPAVKGTTHKRHAWRMRGRELPLGSVPLPVYGGIPLATSCR